jgi:hypothetical protein
MKRASLGTGVLTGVVLSVLALVVVQGTPTTSGAQVGDKFFPETGRTVPAIFYRYWQTHGGLAQQGYPITDARMERNSVDGKEYLTQYFERARFEHHPEFRGTPNEVLLGLLGVEVLKCRTEVAGSTSQKDARGTSDFKFIVRPANSYIQSWCVEPLCADAVIAAGGGSGEDSVEQFMHINYRLVDDGNFNTQTVNRLYVDTLTRAGWTLGPVPGVADNQGQIFFPPNDLKAKVKRAAIWLHPTPNTLTVAVVRTTPIGNPPDLSLFVGH